MAIDSRSKRASLVGIITGVVSVGVTPNVAKPQGWRQAAGWGYFGINAGTPAAGPTETNLGMVGNRLFTSRSIGMFGSRLGVN